MQKKDKIKSIIRRYKFHAAAFCLPILIMAAGFISRGVFPFGENQIAVIDLYHQYLPLISELQFKMHHSGSLFFTWDGLAGCNFWNIIAYQAGSPLNLLLILFPGKYIMEGLTVILLIKIGLAGLFMFIFLKNYYPANDISCRPPVRISGDTATVAFAILYALNAYVMAYYWNIMWMDAVALLPLCILGLRRVIDGGKATLYVITLALIVFTNYYIAIMVCIFIMLYYFVLYFERQRIGKFKGFAKTSVKTLLYSLLGLAMSAVMLLPTFFSMRQASVADSTFPETWFFYKDALDVVNQLLPSAKLSYLEGLPNIYCGMPVLIMLAFYFANKEIRIREKIANTLILVLLFFSFNVSGLDFIWHGMHFPNQLPFRYSFIVCFLLIALSYKAFRHIDRISVKFLGTLLGAGLVYYLIAQKLLKDVVDDVNVFLYCGIAWLSLYSLLFILYRKGCFSFRIMKYALIVLVIVEMSVASISAVDKVGTTTREIYNENVSDMMRLAEQTKVSFVRTEIDDALTINEPARLHYRGLTQFASSMSTDTSGFMKSIGLEASPGGNRSVYRVTNPVTNAILNVKYIISKYGEMDDPDFSKVTTCGESSLFESKYPLSVGYMTPDSMYAYSDVSTNPFENLNEFVACATNDQIQDVFLESGKFDIEGANSETAITEYGTYQAEITDTSEPCEASLTFVSDKEQKYYVFVDCTNDEEISVERSEHEGTDYIDEDYSGIENIGVLNEGETLTLNIKFKEENGGEATAYIYHLDQDKWDTAYSMMSENMLDVQEFSDTHLKGTIDAGKGGIMMTSIPYDKGWKLYVDGKKKDTINLVGNAMITVPLKEGQHEIEMKFIPEGFIPGLIITLLAILLLIVDRKYRDVFTARRKQKSLTAAPEGDEPGDDTVDL